MDLVSKSKKSKRRRVRNVILIVLSIMLVLGLCASFIMLGYYVNALDTVYPNVFAEGHDVSGLTYEQTVQRLIDEDYERGAVGISVTIIFPDDSSFHATGDDCGLALNAAEAAQAAYAFGRGGTFIENTIEYIKAYLNPTELFDLSSPNYNDDILRTLADEHTQIFNDTLRDSKVDINKDSITIVKGTGFHPADADDVFKTSVATMKRAIEQHTHLTVRYIPESKDDSIDLSTVYESIYVEPISAKYDPEITGATMSSPGQTFDLLAAEDKLEKAESGATIVVPIVTVPPEISKDELESMLFRDLLAEREASQGSPSGRVTNIQIAAGEVNGTVLQPGEIFSFNEVVGARTAERGFQEANGIINGRLVPSIGGGVCQVSSTIYAALLQTDIEIVRRQNHSLTVGYLPRGQDATVAYGSLDFRFKNNTDYPLRIDAETSGGVTVSVKIYGTRTSDVYYEVESVQIETTPIEVIDREVTPEDGIEIAPGGSVLYTPGQTGSIWEVWKNHVDAEGNPILGEDGKQIRTLVNKSTYRMQPRLTLHGPPVTELPPDPAPDPAPEG